VSESSTVAESAEERMQRTRANVLNEFVSSESNYLRDLALLQRLFIDPVRWSLASRHFRSVPFLISIAQLEADKQFLKDARDLDKVGEKKKKKKKKKNPASKKLILHAHRATRAIF
jgi:hypothetical protein